MVKKLLEINFQHWEKLSVLLSNIDINFMSMNHDWLQQFNNTVITMKHISKSLESLEDRSFFSIYLSKLKFKESMTINESFEHAKQLLIPKGIYKKDFIHEFEKTKNQEKVLDKLLKSEAENLYLTSIKNYKNVVGHNLLIIARPLIIDLTKDKIELDLKISLLRLLISSKNDSINDVIKRKEYINSYTGEAPIIENDLVCYEVFSKVCLSTKLDSVL